MVLLFNTCLLILSFLFIPQVFSCTSNGGFLPPNNLSVPENAPLQSGISEEDFNLIISNFEKLYSPIVEKKGGRLTIFRNWKSKTVNAYAQRDKQNWKVVMFGGLARHPAITKDGFSLVVCHELGHHLGGTPIWHRLGARVWLTNEGQADYFATLKCLRKAWERDENEAIVKNLEVPSHVMKMCREQHKISQDYFICLRSSMAGLSVANLFKTLHSGKIDPDFSTPDPTVASHTFDSHPAHQCRLDTYFQGALCEVDHNIEVSNSSELDGTCHEKNGNLIGIRPKCWFKPSN